MTGTTGYPRSGNVSSRTLGRLVLAAARFRITGELPAIPKFVVCVAPHTSNWDFVIGYAAKLVVGLRASWLGKKGLFRGPLGPFFRALGGIPVDRSTARGAVGHAASRFKESPALVLGVAPEGTRRRVDHWRTGFYHIAAEAGVPILPVALDWGRRAVRIGEPFLPTGDEEKDLVALQMMFSDVRGRVPENGFPRPTD